MRERSRSETSSRKRNRISTSMISGVGVKRSKAFTKILEMAEKDEEAASANTTLDNSKLVDLTVDDSMLETTTMSEIVPHQAMMDDLPTEASFSKYLEERPSTGQIKTKKHLPKFRNFKES